jgi:hypothetical protein
MQTILGAKPVGPGGILGVAGIYPVQAPACVSCEACTAGQGPCTGCGQSFLTLRSQICATPRLHTSTPLILDGSGVKVLADPGWYVVTRDPGTPAASAVVVLQIMATGWTTSASQVAVLSPGAPHVFVRIDAPQSCFVYVFAGGDPTQLLPPPASVQGCVPPVVAAAPGDARVFASTVVVMGPSCATAAGSPALPSPYYPPASPQVPLTANGIIITSWYQPDGDSPVPLPPDTPLRQVILTTVQPVAVPSPETAPLLLVVTARPCGAVAHTPYSPFTDLAITLRAPLYTPTYITLALDAVTGVVTVAVVDADTLLPVPLPDGAVAVSGMWPTVSWTTPSLLLYSVSTAYTVAYGAEGAPFPTITYLSQVLWAEDGAPSCQPGVLAPLYLAPPPSDPGFYPADCSTAEVALSRIVGGLPAAGVPAQCDEAVDAAKVAAACRQAEIDAQAVGDGDNGPILLPPPDDASTSLWAFGLSSTPPFVYDTLEQLLAFLLDPANYVQGYVPGELPPLVPAQCPYPPGYYRVCAVPDVPAQHPAWGSAEIIRYRHSFDDALTLAFPQGVQARDVTGAPVRYELLGAPAATSGDLGSYVLLASIEVTSVSQPGSPGVLNLYSSMDPTTPITPLEGPPGEIGEASVSLEPQYTDLSTYAAWVVQAVWQDEATCVTSITALPGAATPPAVVAVSRVQNMGTDWTALPACGDAGSAGGLTSTLAAPRTSLASAVWLNNLAAGGTYVPFQAQGTADPSAPALFPAGLSYSPSGTIQCVLLSSRVQWQETTYVRLVYSAGGGAYSWDVTVSIPGEAWSGSSYYYGASLTVMLPPDVQPGDTVDVVLRQALQLPGQVIIVWANVEAVTGTMALAATGSGVLGLYYGIDTATVDTLASQLALLSSTSPALGGLYPTVPTLVAPGPRGMFGGLGLTCFSARCVATFANTVNTLPLPWYDGVCDVSASSSPVIPCQLYDGLDVAGALAVLALERPEHSKINMAVSLNQSLPDVVMDGDPTSITLLLRFGAYNDPATASSVIEFTLSLLNAGSDPQFSAGNVLWVSVDLQSPGESGVTRMHVTQDVGTRACNDGTTSCSTTYWGSGPLPSVFDRVSPADGCMTFCACPRFAENNALKLAAARPLTAISLAAPFSPSTLPDGLVPDVTALARTTEPCFTPAVGQGWALYVGPSPSDGSTNVVVAHQETGVCPYLYSYACVAGFLVDQLEPCQPMLANLPSFTYTTGPVV